MNRVLGIDYGRKKIGLALGDLVTRLSEPHSVIKFKNQEDTFKKISKVLIASNVSKIVMGISEGEMAKETMVFGKRLEKEIGLPVFFQDETLTTQEAGELAIKAGIKRKKRRALEDAYSAALILQAYLDSI